MTTSETLREVLDGRWADVRDLARTTLPPHFFEPVADLDTEQHRERVLKQLLTIADTGIAARGFPRDVGGLDDIGGSVVSVEMLGFADLSLMVKAGVQWGLFGGAIRALGTSTHHHELLPGVISGELLGCFAMTETGHGSDVASLRTTATYDAATDELVVRTPDDDARKDYIGNAARDGRLAVVFAQLVTAEGGHGVHAVLVPLRDDSGNLLPGIKIEDCGRKAGLNGVDNGRIWFDDVRVPRTALLNRFGSIGPDGTYSSPIDNPSRRFFTMLGTLVRGRVSVAAASASATKTALSIAVQYAEQRRQFTATGSTREVRLLDYSAHARRLLPALATTYALHFAQEELVCAIDKHQGAGSPDDPGNIDEMAQRELESRAAGIKAVTTWHATATIQACREACGGHGYLASARLPQLKADTDVFTTFEGDNTVLLQLVAKGLLTGYRNDFEALDTFGTVRFVADQTVETILERTSARALGQRLVDAATRRGEDDVFGRSWQLMAFQDRERHLVEGLARRLRRAGRDESAAFAAFNAAQPHLLAAARAYVDRLALEAFVDAVDACPDPETASLLGQVCDLYALTVVEGDLAWFLQHGRLTSARAKGVTRAVDQLCAALRPNARTLVDGFGIPQEWLASSLL